VNFNLEYTDRTIILTVTGITAAEQNKLTKIELDLNSAWGNPDFAEIKDGRTRITRENANDDHYEDARQILKFYGVEV